jgi:uncharacterized membrane protein
MMHVQRGLRRSIVGEVSFSGVGVQSLRPCGVRKLPVPRDLLMNEIAKFLFAHFLPELLCWCLLTRHYIQKREALRKAQITCVLRALPVSKVYQKVVERRVLEIAVLREVCAVQEMWASNKHTTDRVGEQGVKWWTHSEYTTAMPSTAWTPARKRSAVYYKAVHSSQQQDPDVRSSWLWVHLVSTRRFFKDRLDLVSKMRKKEEKKEKEKKGKNKKKEGKKGFKFKIRR